MKNVRNVKSVKRLTGYVMAGAMAFGLAMTSLPAVTAEAATISVEESASKIKNNTSYEAYQVFTGEYTEDGKLIDIEWGNGVDSTSLLAALAATTEGAAAGITATSTAQDVAEALSKLTDASAQETLAKAIYELTTDVKTSLTAGESATVADGYYLIVDVTTVDGKDVKAKNAALLRVVDADGTITIKQKTDYPEVEKKVEENDTNEVADGGYGVQYNDVADYTIGDTINFHLIGTIPDMSKYEDYKYEFHDTLSEGLDNAENVAVYISADKTLDGEDTLITSGFTTKATGNKLDVVFDDLKDVEGATAGKYIIVSYDSKLNSKAVVGLDGNVNEVYLTYSSNPNQSGGGTDKPNDTTNTPKDYNIIFTYQVEGKKIDGATKEALADAEFYLKNADGEYARVENGKFVSWEASKETATKLVSDSTETTKGIFSVAGLDEGTYYLEEETAPTGYNKLRNDVKIVVEATTDNSQTWNGSEADAAKKAFTAITINVDDEKDENDALVKKAGTVSDGKVTLDVENNSGSTLPETGGMGRRLIYLLGSSLVAGVGAIFGIRKRRA